MKKLHAKGPRNHDSSPGAIKRSSLFRRNNFGSCWAKKTTCQDYWREELGERRETGGGGDQFPNDPCPFRWNHESHVDGSLLSKDTLCVEEDATETMADGLGVLLENRKVTQDVSEL